MEVRYRSLYINRQNSLSWFRICADHDFNTFLVLKKSQKPVLSPFNPKNLTRIYFVKYQILCFIFMKKLSFNEQIGDLSIYWLLIDLLIDYWLCIDFSHASIWASELWYLRCAGSSRAARRVTWLHSLAELSQLLRQQSPLRHEHQRARGQVPGSVRGELVDGEPQSLLVPGEGFPARRRSFAVRTKRHARARLQPHRHGPGSVHVQLGLDHHGPLVEPERISNLFWV